MKPPIDLIKYIENERSMLSVILNEMRKLPEEIVNLIYKYEGSRSYIGVSSSKYTALEWIHSKHEQKCSCKSGSNKDQNK